MQVLVRDNNVDQALKALKKKMQREGLLPSKPRPVPGAGPGGGGHGGHGGHRAPRMGQT
ncbi:MAG: 30S ribosomal protein S21 [Pseudolabrys sp.]